MRGIRRGLNSFPMGSVGRWSSVFTRRRLALLALVLGGAGLVYAFAFRKPRMMFDRRVDEVLREWQKHSDDGERMRIEGALVPGSLVRLESCEHRFRLTANGREIPVRVPPHEGRCPALPDTFCVTADATGGVVVEGYVEGTAERPGFVAEGILVKLPRFDLGEPLPRFLPVPLAR